MSLKKRYLRNSFFNVLGWIWVSILSLVTIPIIIKHIGIEQYGIFVLVNLILGYFAFLDFGLGDAVVKFVSEYFAKGHMHQINKIINSILFLYVIIGLIGAILIIFFTKFFALKLFKISQEFEHVAQLSLYLAAFGFLLNLIMAVFSRIPDALQRFDITNKVLIFMGSLVNIGNIIAVLRGGKLISLVIVNLIGSIIGVILYYISSKKILKNLEIDFKFSWKDFKNIFSFGLYTAFSRLAFVVSSSLFQIIIAVILGPVSVAIYNVPKRLLSRLQALGYRLSYVIFPLVSELKARNNMDKIYQVYEKLSKYMFYVFSVLCISVASFSFPILRYWIGEDFAEKGSLVLILLTFGYYLDSISMVPSLVANGMGKPKYNAIFSMLNGIFGIILLIIFSRKFGVTGSAIAFLIASLNVIFFIIIVNKRILKISSIKYYKNVFLKGSIISLALMFVYIKFLNGLARDLRSFLFVFLLSLLVSSFIFYLNVEYQDREVILSKLKILNAPIILR